MTDVATTLRAGMSALAADTEARVSPPPVETVTGRPVVVPLPRRRRRRLLKVVAGVGAGVALTTSAAAATGTLPDSVSAVLADMREWGFPTRDDEARVVATASGADFSYESWLAPLDDGTYCSYIRVVGSEDNNEMGGSSCGFSLEGIRHTMSVAYPEVTGPEDDLVEGRMPDGVTQIEVVLGDGTTLTAHAQVDGWFILVVPAGVPDGTAIVDIRPAG